MAKVDKNNLYGIYVNVFLLHNKHCPNQRLGQFIDNFFVWMDKNYDKDVFYLENDELVKYMAEYVEGLTNEETAV